VQQQQQLSRIAYAFAFLCFLLLQLSAIQQAQSLIGQSLEDMRLASAAVYAGEANTAV
jgi:hypothetical protein